jgi:hypothetical protein
MTINIKLVFGVIVFLVFVVFVFTNTKVIIDDIDLDPTIGDHLSVFVKMVSIERVDPSVSINLSDVELYDHKNNKIIPSNLSASFNQSFVNPPVLHYMRITLDKPVRLSKIIIMNRNGVSFKDGDVVRTINDEKQELSRSRLSEGGSVYTLSYDVNTGLNANVTSV